MTATRNCIYIGGSNSMNMEVKLAVILCEEEWSAPLMVLHTVLSIMDTGTANLVTFQKMILRIQWCYFFAQKNIERGLEPNVDFMWTIFTLNCYMVYHCRKKRLFSATPCNVRHLLAEIDVAWTRRSWSFKILFLDIPYFWATMFPLHAKQAIFKEPKKKTVNIFWRYREFVKPLSAR